MRPALALLLPEEPEKLLDDRPEAAVRYTKPGIDEAQGARH